MESENIIWPQLKGVWSRERHQPLSLFCCQLMVYLGFFLVAATIPINHTNTIESAGVILVLTGVIGGRVVRKDWKIRANPLHLPILFMLAVILLSLFSAYDLSYTLDQIWSEFLTYTALFYAVVDFCRERKVLQRLLLLLALANLLALGLFFREFSLTHFSQADFLLALFEKEMFSKGLPAESTYCLVVSSFYYAALFFLPRKRDFLPVGVLLSANLYLLYLCYQRAGILAMAVVAVVPLFFCRAVTAKRIPVAILLGLGLFLLLLITPIKSKFIYPNWRQTISGQFIDHPNDQDSIQLRLGIQWYFLKYFMKHPFTGVGYGKTNLRKVEAQSPEPPPARVIHSHNVFFDFALQTGLQGLAAYLLLVFAQFRLAVQGIKRSTGLFDRFLFTGSLYFLAGFWVRMQFDDVYRSGTALAYWLIMALMVSLWLMVSSEPGNG